MNSKKFSIEFDSKAARELKKLCRNNPALLSSLTKTIDSLISGPLQGKALSGNKEGCYSLRKGDYRIIYEIYPSQGVVHIIRVGHRRDIYR